MQKLIPWAAGSLTFNLVQSWQKNRDCNKNAFKTFKLQKHSCTSLKVLLRAETLAINSGHTQTNQHGTRENLDAGKGKKKEKKQSREAVSSAFLQRKLNICYALRCITGRRQPCKSSTKWDMMQNATAMQNDKRMIKMLRWLPTESGPRDMSPGNPPSRLAAFPFSARRQQERNQATRSNKKEGRKEGPECHHCQKHRQAKKKKKEKKRFQTKTQTR